MKVTMGFISANWILNISIQRKTYHHMGWRKDSSKWIEAPHIYYENGWYYLLVAEGGTFTNHSVMMARSRKLMEHMNFVPEIQLYPIDIFL